MKIFAIGDFHGKFPDKLKNIIKKENPDLILSNGDYTGIDEWRPLLNKMFKHSAKGKEFSISEYLGKKKYNNLIKRDYAAGKVPLKQLDNFGIKVLSVFGNGDWYKNEFDRADRKNYEKFIKKLNNVKDINRGKANFCGLKFVGFGGYLNNDIYFTKKGMKAINSDIKTTERRRKIYNLEEKRLMKLMKFKPDILLAHYTPYKCLDKMKTKGFALTGSHMGISMFNWAIKKYSPKLMVCGHMHENQGSCKLGKTLVVNPGAAVEGKAAIIEFNEKTKRVLNVRFIR